MSETLDEKRPAEDEELPTEKSTRDGAPVGRVPNGRGNPGRPWARAVGWLRAVPRRMVVVALVLVTVLAAGGAWWMNRGLPDDVAVRVGDTDVTVADLRDRMATLEALYGVTVPDDAATRKEFWRDATQSVAVGIVLADAARAEDVAVTDNDVDQAVRQVVASFFGPGAKGESGFAQALADAGTSEAAVRDELQRQLEINALFAAATGDVESPTDGEVADAYAERRCSLVVPDKRRIRNVVVPTRADGNDALRRLRGGESFASVASVMSIDASTQASGGDLGLVAAADLEPDYATAAFGVGDGELFGPVKSKYGWNVGLVEAVQKARVPGLAAVRDQLRRALLVEAQSRAWRSWMRAQLKKADVQYADDYRPADPLELPADTAPGPDGIADESATGDVPAC